MWINSAWPLSTMTGYTSHPPTDGYVVGEMLTGTDTTQPEWDTYFKD